MGRGKHKPKTMYRFINGTFSRPGEQYLAGLDVLRAVADYLFFAYCANRDRVRKNDLLAATQLIDDIRFDIDPRLQA